MKIRELIRILRTSPILKLFSREERHELIWEVCEHNHLCGY